MRQLLITAVIVLLVAACAPNPLGLAEGMWVRHKIDGQKYFITELRRDAVGGSRIRVKNELGVEVDKNFKIFEFELWIERKSVPDGVANNLEQELRRARLALEAANTPENRANLERQIEQVEELSPTFRQRKWNPETEQYE